MTVLEVRIMKLDGKIRMHTLKFQYYTNYVDREINFDACQKLEDERIVLLDELEKEIINQEINQGMGKYEKNTEIRIHQLDKLLPTLDIINKLLKEKNLELIFDDSIEEKSGYGTLSLKERYR